MSSSDCSESSKTDPTGFLDENFSLKEVHEAVLSLKSSKARGIDDIPNECFKFAPPELIDSLLLMEHSCNIGNAPNFVGKKLKTVICVF